jgi:hypothetical protein
MLFLIHYDREAGRLIRIQAFASTDVETANRARLELELRLNRSGVANEVVLLEAPSESDLRRTHRRYFAGIAELAANTATAVREETQDSPDRRRQGDS